MKKLGLLCTAALLTLSLAACSGNGGKQGGTDNNGGTANTGDKQLKVAIVLSTGGLGDKNFNDMSYDGLTQAKADFGDRKSTRLNSSHIGSSRMPSSA